MLIKNKEDIKVLSMTRITAVANHHSAWKKQTQFKAINDLHKSKFGMKSTLGYYGGYNLLIEKNGDIRQYRALGEELAAHYSHNTTKLAICCAGDFRTEEMTTKQKASLVWLYEQILSFKTIPMDIRHGDLSSNNTTCPALPKAYYSEIYRQARISSLKKMIIYLKQLILAFKNK